MTAVASNRQIYKFKVIAVDKLINLRGGISLVGKRNAPVDVFAGGVLVPEVVQINVAELFASLDRQVDGRIALQNFFAVVDYVLDFVLVQININHRPEDGGIIRVDSRQLFCSLHHVLKISFFEVVNVKVALIFDD